MSKYQVIARKFRPQIFEDVIGQKPIVQTLQNAIQMGRIGHAYLFSGPRGVGKTTTVAKIASEAILKRGLKVGLINLDGYKVAAFDQLGTYARILNVPFRSAATNEDLLAAIANAPALGPEMNPRFFDDRDSHPPLS